MLAQDERLVRRVGAVSLVVLTLAIAFFVFVYDRIDWGSHIHVRVYFHRTGGLREGAQFVVGGRDVGKVEAIALVPHGAPGPLNGDEGVVATVAIDSSIVGELHLGDMFVASRGALSGKYLELGPAPVGAPTLHDGEPILGKDPPTVDRVLESTWNQLRTMGEFANEVKPEMDALRAQIDELRSHLDTTAGTTATLVPSIDRTGPLVVDAFEISAGVQQLRERSLGGDAGIAHARAAIAHARTTVADIRAKLARLSASVEPLAAALATARARVGAKGPELAAKLDLAIDRIRAAMAKADALIAQIDELNAAIERGEGSALKLMHDPEFPEDAKELGKIMKRQPWKVMAHPQK